MQKVIDKTYVKALKERKLPKNADELVNEAKAEAFKEGLNAYKISDSELEAGVTDEISFGIGESQYTVTLGKNSDNTAVVMINNMDVYQESMKARLENIDWI